VLLLALFVLNERRAQQPIMPLRLFASRERSGAYAARILFLGAMMGFWFFITQFLQGVYGYSPLAAGVAFLPMTLANFAVAVAVPRLTHRFGNGLLLAGGLTVTLLGMFWLSRLSAATPYLTGIALPMVLIGIGQGATLAPLTAAGHLRRRGRRRRCRLRAPNVAHQLGGSLGLGILVVHARAAAHLCAPSGIAHFSAVAAGLGGDDAGMPMPADGYRSAGLSEVASRAPTLIASPNV